MKEDLTKEFINGSKDYNKSLIDKLKLYAYLMKINNIQNDIVDLNTSNYPLFITNPPYDLILPSQYTLIYIGKYELANTKRKEYSSKNGINRKATILTEIENKKEIINKLKTLVNILDERSK